MTVTLKAAPAVTLAGVVTASLASAPGLTTIVPLTPWALPAAAVSVTLWAVSRVMEGLAAPLFSVTVAGITAWPSLAVSVKAPLALLPYMSVAVMLTGKALPAGALPGALRVMLAGAAGLTTSV